MRSLSCGRRAPRKTVNLRCTVKPKSGRKRNSRVADLSRLGAWLVTKKPLPIGELIELTIRTVTLRAEVMWTRAGKGMAVEFVPCATAGMSDSERLGELLAASPPKRGDDTAFTFADAY